MKRSMQDILKRKLALLILVTLIFSNVNTYPVMADPTGTFTFYIKDDVQGIEGANVTIYYGSGSNTSISGEDGSAAFDLNSISSEDLKKGISGYSITKTGYEDVSVNVVSGSAITIEAGSMEIPMMPLTKQSISGRVTDGIKEVSGAAITLTGYQTYNAVTDDEGNYSIPDVYGSNLTGKEYMLSISKDDYFNYSEMVVVTNVDVLKDIAMVEKLEQEPLVFHNPVPEPINIVSNNGILFSNSATGGSGNGLVSYEIISQTLFGEEGSGNVAEIDPNTGLVTFGHAGTIKVKAVKAGDDQYKEAEAFYQLTFLKADITDFKFEIPSPANINTESIFVNPAKSILCPETNDIIYSVVEGSEVASVNPLSGELTIDAAGTLTIQAVKASNAFYNEAKAQYKIIIDKANQSALLFNNQNPAPIYWNEPLTNTVTGGKGCGIITYSSSDSTIAKVNSDGSIIGKKAGEVTITATKDSDKRYYSISSSYKLILKRIVQDTFHFTAENISIDYSQPYEVMVEGGKGTGGITFSSSDTSIAEFMDPTKGVLTTKQAGTVIITAAIAQDEQYESKTITTVLTVNHANQLIQFSKPEGDFHITYGEAFSNTSFGGEGTGEIYYEITDGNQIAEIDRSSGTLTFHNGQVGNLHVKAHKSQCNRYKAAMAEYNLTVDYLAIPENPYTIEGETLNDSGWYTKDITIKPKEGYAISYSNALTDNEWKESLIYDKEGISTANIYLKDIKTGFITDVISIPDIKLDKTAPEEMKVIRTDSLADCIMQNITFCFYQPEVMITLEAKDIYSQVESLSYECITEDGKVQYSGDIPKEKLEFSNENKTVRYNFKIPDQFRGYVTFLATDVAGNTAKNIDDKMIVVDNIAPQATITYNNPVCYTDADNNVQSSISDKTIFLYKDKINATIEVKEANFFEGTPISDVEFVNDIKVIVKKVDLNNTVTKTEYVPYETKKENQAKLVWVSEGDSHKAVISLNEDGDYTVSVEYKDKSEMEMVYHSALDKKSGNYKYESNLLRIDKTSPVIEVNSAAKLSNKDISVNFRVKEHNFNAAYLDISMSASDIDGYSMIGIDKTTFSSYLKQTSNWSRGNGDTWSTSINLSQSANYNIRFSYTDNAGNVSNTAETYATVDKEPPRKESLGITYSTSVLDTIINNISFGFYRTPVTVTISADDVVSGVQCFEYDYTVSSDASEINKGLDGNNFITSEHIDYGRNKKTASASFQIPPEFRGNVTFCATDMANNKSEFFNDPRVIVVDSISPTRTVSLNPVQIVDADTLETIANNVEGSNSKLFFQGDAVLNLTINEANFYGEDVKISVKKDDLSPYDYKPERWVKDKDNWSALITLSGDGDYYVTVEYMDRSINQMVTYQSGIIVIDTIKPEINTNYKQDEVKKSSDGVNYFDKLQKVTVEVTEHNFRPQDINAVVTAETVNGKKVEISDYNQYLKDSNNWTRAGDTYTAELTYNTDANYTFDISCKDLALNDSVEYNTDKFSIDTTAPKNLSISYSDNVLDTVIENISFGFYNTKATVTINAEDDTAGIDYFIYSCINDEGALGSSVIDQKITKDRITYSEDGKKATATFTVPRANLDQNGQFRGKINFTTYDKSGNQTKYEDKKVTVIDSIAPNLDVSYNDPVSMNKEVYYYPNNVEVNFHLREENFYQEDINMTVSKDGQTVNDMKPIWTKQGGEWLGTFQLEAKEDHSQDGVYFIHVTYTDKSSNTMNSYVSHPIVIDTIKPIIQLHGVTNESANKDKTIGFRMNISDVNIDNFEPNLSATFRDETGELFEEQLDIGEVTTIEEGKEYSYQVDNLLEDGVYHVGCVAGDLAGNVCDTVSFWNEEAKKYIDVNQGEDNNITFSVNRNGSTFVLDEETKKLVNDYYVQQVPAIIRISEVNVDPLVNYDVKLNNVPLKKGVDYTVQETMNQGAWCEYNYLLNKNLFSKEGKYSTIVNSVDKAGTQSFSDIEKAEVSFIVDRTKPEITLSGIENNGRYRSESKIVNIIPKDPGGRLHSLKVMLNQSEVITDLTGNYLENALEESSGRYTFEIPGGMDQKVRIECMDEAGNKNVLEYANITVSKDWYILFYANKPLFWSSVGGSAFLLLMSITILSVKRRKRLAARNQVE